MKKRGKTISRSTSNFGYVVVSALSNRLSGNCLSHERRNTANITISCGNRIFHDSTLLKTPEDSFKVDTGVLHAEHPNQYAVKVDKGYQGLELKFVLFINFKNGDMEL